jgi:serine/threonine protein kinase
MNDLTNDPKRDEQTPQFDYKQLNERYQLRKLIGQGAMGTVYSGYDQDLQRIVAVKRVVPNEQNEASIEYAMREARILANLSHPNIVKVYDVLNQGGSVFIINECVDGEALSEHKIKFSVPSILAIGAQLLRGISAAHSGGVIHRDIKPSNVMLQRDGRVVLVDFGVAFSQARSSGETVAGSIRYTSPEVLEGKPSCERSDLFAAGLVIVELLTGKPLLPDLAPLPLYRFYQNDFRDLVERTLDGVFPPLAEVLEQLFLDSFDSPSSTVFLNSELAANRLHRILSRIDQRNEEQIVADELNQEQIPESVDLAMVKWADQTISDESYDAQTKAKWFAFREEICQSESTDSPHVVTSQRLDKSRQRRQKIKKLAIRKVVYQVIALGISLLFVSHSWHRVRVSLESYLTGGSTVPFQNIQISDLNHEVSKERVKEVVKEAIKEVVEEAKTESMENARVDGEKIDIAEMAAVAAEKTIETKPSTLKPLVKAREVIVSFTANAWCDVYIDDVKIGRLPNVDGFKVSPGKKQIRLVSPFIETLDKKLLITRNKKQRFTFAVTAKQSTHVIRLQSPANLVIDGQEQGHVIEKTMSLSFGNHQVWIKRGPGVVEKSVVAIGPSTPEVIVIE